MRPTPAFPAELIAAASSAGDTASPTLEAVIERLHDEVILPARATAGSAGYDLRAYLKQRAVRCSDGATQSERAAAEAEGGWGITLRPGEMALIPLGFRTRLPEGIEAQVRPRSGQVFKQALTIPNAPGTVDADYAEEWMVVVRNDGPVARRIVHGERIAQAVFARHVVLELREGMVQRTTERAGGFGSTGKS
ncbi:MAG: dUTP diphosphatase [Gemmatimonadaceae bacterium]|nr:dUTP diphosphatase [Gemmatimonadaceae bacterium]NUP70090.1 dUTP diphosphatase [Gemmatimonadaceae bacterium]NUR35622.1 dUTP diphosphatase [Gemmatimonadaceae bacterium]NUS31821.1 dUTP diphosphatase [Gemmatimonadaceae bacterium]